MADNVQCPNCGGYKVKLEQEIKGSKVEQERFESPGCFGLSIIGIVCFSLLGFLSRGVAFVIAKIFSDETLIFPIWAVLGIISVVFTIWVVVSSHLRAEKYQQEGLTTGISREFISGYCYYCYICGNHWTWMVGTPWPRVTLQPELLAKVESQRWICAYCGSSNEGFRRYCYVCNYPKT